MYLWIDNILEDIKESCNTHDIYELYDFFNISIVKPELPNILLKNNDSFYHRNYFGDELVLIRNDLNIHVEKFILAHELGHSLLHTHIYEATFNKRFINLSKCEKQANYFAFKLLNISIDKLQFKGFTIEQIARSLYIPIDSLKNIASVI